MTNDKANQICAEKMGWTPYKTLSPIDRKTEITLWEHSTYGTLCAIPQFTSDLNAAVTLLDQLAKEGWQIEIYKDDCSKDHWRVRVILFAKNRPWQGKNQSLPLAIVECALRAWGAWEDEK